MLKILMKKSEKKACKVCGKLYPRDFLSHRGLCPDCAMRNMRQAILQLKRKRGPYYEKWLRNVMRARKRGGKNE